MKMKSRKAQLTNQTTRPTPSHGGVSAIGQLTTVGIDRHTLREMGARGVNTLVDARCTVTAMDASHLLLSAVLPAERVAAHLAGERRFNDDFIVLQIRRKEFERFAAPQGR